MERFRVRGEVFFPLETACCGKLFLSIGIFSGPIQLVRYINHFSSFLFQEHSYHTIPFSQNFLHPPHIKLKLQWPAVKSRGRVGSRRRNQQERMEEPEKPKEVVVVQDYLIMLLGPGTYRIFMPPSTNKTTKSPSKHVPVQAWTQSATDEKVFDPGYRFTITISVSLWPQ